MGTSKLLAKLEPDVAEWGRRLAGRRTDLNKSQVWVAEQLTAMTGQKLDQSYVSKLERGLRAPTEPQRTALARILATTVWVLFPYPDDGP